MNLIDITMKSLTLKVYLPKTNPIAMMLRSCSFSCYVGKMNVDAQRLKQQLV